MRGYFDFVQSVVMGFQYDKCLFFVLEFGHVEYFGYFWRVNVNYFVCLVSEA